VGGQARVVLDEGPGPAGRSGVINFLGLIIFATIIVIGAIDGRSGLSLLAVYDRPNSPDQNPPTSAGDRAAL
jgi:hypothetical protein